MSHVICSVLALCHDLLMNHLCNFHPTVSNLHLQHLIFPDTAPHQHAERPPETLRPPSITLTDPGEWLLAGF